MDGIQFVYEKPHKPVRTVKKRTRLITSCDACRLKKIKCRSANHADNKCESCEALGSACVFSERDRIRSQRGIASFTVAPTRYSRKTKGARASPAQTSSPVITAGANGCLQTATFTLSSMSTGRSGQDCSGPSSPCPRSHDKVSQTLNEHSNRSPLFDPHRQAYPQRRLLSHLIDIFFTYTGSVFPFFDPDETARAGREGSLSPLLANSLAAYSARFSDQIDHLPGSRHQTGEPFLDIAKGLLLDSTRSNLEKLQATIIVAWAENGAGRPNKFYDYGQLACSLTIDLRLDSEEDISQEPREKTRNQLRLLFWSVVWLDIISCSVNGKRCTFHPNECTTNMPYPEIDSCGPLPRVTMYQAFRGVLNLMVYLNDCANAGNPRSPSIQRDYGLREIRDTATNLQNWLPSSLAFNKENLSLSSLLCESFAFYLVHALMHCFLVVTHCPSLFWVSQPPATVTEVPRLDIAWTSAMAIIDILILTRSENILFTIGLSSTFMPILIAQGAFLVAQSNATDAINGTNMTIEEFELTNRYYLGQCAELLKELSRYWATMSQIEISAEPVALCRVQPIPPDPKGMLFPDRSVSFIYRMPPLSVQIPSVPHGSIEDQDGPEQPMSQSDGNWHVISSSYADIDAVSNGVLIRRYNSWQDMIQPSANA